MKAYLWKNLPLLIFLICKTCCPLLMALLACLVRSTPSQSSVNMDVGQVRMTEAQWSVITLDGDDLHPLADQPPPPHCCLSSNPGEWEPGCQLLHLLARGCWQRDGQISPL